MEESELHFLSKNIPTNLNSSTKSNMDSWLFFLKNNKICEIIEVKRNEDITVNLYSFRTSLSFFHEPVDSKLLGICFLPNNSHFKITISRADITKKFVAFPDEEGILLIPVLHNLNL